MRRPPFRRKADTSHAEYGAKVNAKINGRKFARIRNKAYRVGWSGLTADEQRWVLALNDALYMAKDGSGTVFDANWFTYGTAGGWSYPPTREAS